MKEITKLKLKGYKWAKKLVEQGALKNVPYHMVKQSDIRKELIKEIKQGCGNKVNSDGDCFYISSQGNLRLCSSCTRALKYLEGDE